MPTQSESKKKTGEVVEKIASLINNANEQIAKSADPKRNSQALSNAVTCIDEGCQLLDEAIKYDDLPPADAKELERLIKEFVVVSDNINQLIEKQLKEEQEIENGAIKPYIKIISSGDVAGIVNCFNRKPNSKYLLGVNEYDATLIETGKTQTSIVWKGGVLKPTGVKLAHFILMKYSGSPTITFTLQEFMQYTGIPNRDQAARYVAEEIVKLRSMQIEIEGKGYSGGFSIWGTYYRNNIIIVTLTLEGDAIFRRAKGFLWFPHKLLLLSLQYHPHSITLGTFFSQQKAMNWGKRACDVYKVLWLIENYTDIPDPQTIKEKHNSLYKKLMIIPFERDMNACSHLYIFNWRYLQGSGNSWAEFRDAVIEIKWKDHPQDKLARITNKLTRTTQKLKPKK